MAPFAGTAGMLVSVASAARESIPGGSAASPLEQRSLTQLCAGAMYEQGAQISMTQLFLVAIIAFFVPAALGYFEHRKKERETAPAQVNAKVAEAAKTAAPSLVGP